MATEYLVKILIIVLCVLVPTALALFLDRRERKRGLAQLAAVAPLRSGIKFAKGTQIVCPGCGALIATVNTDIYRYAMGRSAEFDWLQPHELCDRMACKVCNENYMSDPNSMHTQFGWRDQVTEEDLLTTATGEQQ